MLKLIIEYHRRKLEKMILLNDNYDNIVKQSQILDHYLNRLMRITLKLH